MKNKLIEIVKKIQTKLDEKEKNVFLRTGRKTILGYLEFKKFNKRDLKILKSLDLIQKLEEYYNTLEDRKDDASVQINCEDSLEINFLEFDEIVDENFYWDYLFNKINETSDVLMLITLSIVNNGGILYVPDVNHAPSQGGLSRGGQGKKIEIYLNYLPQPIIGNVVLVITENNSKATIIENNINIEDSKLQLSAIRTFVGNQSEINYIYIHNQAFKHSFINKDIILFDNAIFKLDSLLLKGGGRICVNTYLNGINAEYIHKGFFVFSEQEKYFLDCSNFHKKNNTKSNACLKTILNNNSEIDFLGIINVNNEASGSVASLESKNLVLENSKINAEIVPVLELNSNECNVKHSATIEKIDKEQIYYLMSRGLTEEQAQKNLVKAYLDGVSDLALSNEIKKLIKTIINKKLC